ncbi:hypothetical protein [Chitinophaga filiformis]|uniref:Uncharacterized protein n=1 Tax=Chitinophaga filiformis TaxID=104663 RepID=A0A1G7MGD8_CHIFI|nr:hypothetical protein [Chitinophaga filiformis]SDF60761.1 hypothetical protein SAMN04488121_102415 [Chitinophaga filiformis]
MKQLYITLTLLFTLSIAAVVALYLMQPAPVKNGFIRRPIYKAQQLQQLKLEFNHWYISRIDHNRRIYLGNYKARLSLFSCSYSLQDTTYQKLSFPDSSRLKLELLKSEMPKKIEPSSDNFSTDGFLCLDEATGHMVYTYYYRNVFVYLNRDLNTLFTGMLIDTNTVGKIKLGTYKANGKTIRTMAQPALVINKRGFTDGKWYYNHAALAGDNELLNDFNKHEVIDVYRLSDSRYSHSIYLPKHPEKKLTDFIVRGDKLVALYENYLVTYILT